MAELQAGEKRSVTEEMHGETARVLILLAATAVLQVNFSTFPLIIEDRQHFTTALQQIRKGHFTWLPFMLAK